MKVVGSVKGSPGLRCEVSVTMAGIELLELLEMAAVVKPASSAT